ncbi:MAG: ribbon-helix-helix domain-containing protein [Thermotogota bacterium]
MSTKKITVTLDESVVEALDSLVKKHFYKSRSKAIQIAIVDYLKNMEKQKMYAEIDKMDREEEMKVAEESLEASNEIWTEY